MTHEEFRREYVRLAHAVQSGVAIKLEHGSQEGTPKHLRTGLNCVMQDLGSLTLLLVSKGVISEDEYFSAVLDGLRREIAMYEVELSAKYGVSVKLG